MATATLVRRYCSGCGLSVGAQEKFCSTCGTHLG
jgi:hypothetical protein